MRFVIALRKDLFGGRLLNFLQAWQIARAARRHLVVLWPGETPFLPGSYDFFDLFDRQAFLERHPGVTIVPSYELDDIAAAMGVSSADLIDSAQSGERPSAPGGGPDIVWHRDTKPRPVAERDPHEFRSLFGELQLSQPVADALATFDGVDFSESLAVHLRRGDFINARLEVDGKVLGQGLFALKDLSNTKLVNELIFNFIVKYVPLPTVARITQKTPLVTLFSDVADDRRAMEGSLGARLIDVHAELDRWPLTPLQRAFCEWVLMSRSPRILATKSNFSTSAAMLGGAQIIRAHKWMRADEALTDVDDFIALSLLGTEDREALRVSLTEAYRKEFARIGQQEEAAFCQRRLERLQTDGAVYVP